ncbi:hypothetical protein ILUMI_01722 [Ignelater luminosus]|uniref:Uncharacterized protein n=1 Tax=Ignelater luminosus TaxID=2038154 RepID=A0A8K0GLG3_IGNLU|nr:hypothetical protein ILUMI_01722 [Ignelater luminosus]
MKKRGQTEARIDFKLFEQLEDERKYWRNVLLRVVVAGKSLATRGLSFRGKTDKFKSTNMMLSEFDPVDSTPDITNVDQLSLTVRFVQDKAEPLKRFLCFLSNTGHKAEDMLLAVMDTFKTLNVNLMTTLTISALEAIKSDSAHQKALVKNKATRLLAQLDSLETAILSEFWESILKQFNIVSRILQGVDTDVELVSRLYDSLITFVENKRDSFDAFEVAGKKNPHKNTEAVVRELLRGKNETISITREKCCY